MGKTILDGLGGAAASVETGPFAMLARRLALHSSLDAGDRALLAALPAETRTIEPYGYFIRPGEPSTVCAVLLSGFAFRQKTARDGGRQIVAIHVPGDGLDLQNLRLDVADHAVQALTRITIATVGKEALLALTAERDGVCAAIMRDMLIEASVYREWMLNLGRRDARARISHFLCELFVRLDMMGLAEPDGFALPMSQEQLGDLVGLTPIHVNRTLKGLEQDGLIARTRRIVRVPDRALLAAAGDFDPVYLHLRRPPAANA